MSLIHAMIVSLKNNALPKRKGFRGWDKYNDNIYKKHKALEFKKVSTEERRIIRERFRATQRRERTIQITLTLLILITISVILFKLINEKVKLTSPTDKQTEISTTVYEQKPAKNSIYHLNAD